jgi:hypothetical protein
MLKKLILLTVTAVSLVSLPAQAWRNDEITMLVIPREVLPLQIGQDISRRYPVILVSYQTLNNKLKIHAWNGDDWVFVPVEDYTNGTFFTNRPKTAIIVENGKSPAPDVLTPGSLWCESASRLTSTDPRVMLHLLGLSFDFPFRHWDQLAKRYGYALEEINPTLENVYWWNLQGDVLMKKRARRDFSVDLNHWQPLATIPAPVIQPVTMEKTAEPAGATAVEITAKAPEAPVIETVPAVEPTATGEEPAAPAPEAAPAIETKSSASDNEPSASAETGPVMDPSPAVEPQPAVEPAPVANPDVMLEDPFTAGEVPAAEIIVPPEPKKPWWKLF